jgi:hypothetical protein
LRHSLTLRARLNWVESESCGDGRNHEGAAKAAFAVHRNVAKQHLDSVQTPHFLGKLNG